MSLALPILSSPGAWLARSAAQALLMTSSQEPESPDARARANAELIRRMAGGDRDALAELYDRLSRPLYATAKHILNDATEAQDVVHDVFLALWENAAAFDTGRGAAFSWAVTLTRNRSIDRLRTRTNRARLLEASFPGDLAGGGGADLLGGDDRAELGDRADVVATAMETLPAEQKRALEL